MVGRRRTTGHLQLGTAPGPLPQVVPSTLLALRFKAMCESYSYLLALLASVVVRMSQDAIDNLSWRAGS